MEDIVPEVLSEEEQESENNNHRDGRYERRAERRRIQTRLIFKRLRYLEGRRLESSIDTVCDSTTEHSCFLFYTG